MKKTITCLAVTSAALAAGNAAAQSSVEIYGSVDLGFTHRGHYYQKGVGSKNGIDSGSSAGDRLGFRGTEDLGNGLKALFTLESGFNTDTVSGSTSRQAFAGLSGGFGTVLVGRQYSLHFGLNASIDPFYAGTVGEYRNLFFPGPAAGGAENPFDPTRIDNVVTYISPTFSGFKVLAQYSPNVEGDEGSHAEVSGAGPSIDNDGDLKFAAIMPRYTSGPLDIGLSWQRFQSDGYYFTVDNPKSTSWTLAGTYDFGFMKLAGFYDAAHLKGDAAPSVINSNLKLENWMLGATFPFGKHAVQLTYARSRFNHDFKDARGTLNGKARQIALGYTYALSKRTNLYAAYADIDNDSKRKDIFRQVSPVHDAGNNNSGYQNGFQFGVLHKF
jgi:predicted porin